MNEKRRFSQEDLQKHIAMHFQNEAKQAITKAGYARYAEVDTSPDETMGVAYQIWANELIRALQTLEDLTAQILLDAILANYDSSGSGSY